MSCIPNSHEWHGFHIVDVRDKKYAIFVCRICGEKEDIEINED